jgi:DeoR/GlpR family transcriptional regulator of sugar metabolism
VNDRKARILTMLKANESVAIADLSKALRVSRETVRKDLGELETEGLLTKVRGGAVITAGNAETAYDLRLGKEREAKQAIARAAAELVESGDTVYLDYGTTNYMLARELLHRDGITVVTCALPIVEQLVANPAISVMSPGGIVRNNENSFYGPMTARNLRTLHMDIGFFGCSGVDPRFGFTNPNQFESEISSLAMEQSSRIVMVVDHSKFGIRAANQTAAVEVPDLLITDQDAPAEVLTALQATGLEVLKATGEDSAA